MDRGWIRFPKIWLEVSEGRLFCSACSVYLGAHSSLSAVLNNRAVSSQIRMVKKALKPSSKKYHLEQNSPQQQKMLFNLK